MVFSEVEAPPRKINVTSLVRFLSLQSADRVAQGIGK